MSNLAAQELQSFVRRIEALDDEIRALNADKSEVFKEAKSDGYNVKTLRKVIAARRMDSSEREAADEEFDLYWHAIHGADHGHVRARVENVEEFDADGVESSAHAGSSNGRTTAFETVNAGSTPAPATNVSSFKTAKPLRPHCLKPEACGGQGRQHCWSCTKAMNEAGAA